MTIKRSVVLFLVFILFYPVHAVSESPEIIPWNLVPNEEIHIEPEEDEPINYSPPSQQYNVNINIRKNNQPYYSPFFYPYHHRKHKPATKPPSHTGNPLRLPGKR